MNNSHTSQVVIITGGAQGIGFGIATCFAQKGATLVIADAKAPEAIEAADKLKTLGAADAIGIGCDITQRAQVDAMVAQVMERFGCIDVLVNNAGISPFVEIMELSPELFDKVMSVNLTGAFHCTQAVAAHMKARWMSAEEPNDKPRGRVVFISSLAPQFSQPSQVEYSASKAGVEGLMRGFATALGPFGITSNAVAPGMILTPLTEFRWAQPGPAEHIKTLVPVGRIGRPEDIGKAVVFLASPDADYINGTTIEVDGGFSKLIKG